MSIDLAPDVWNAIQRQLATGSYSSPDEVLREALAALQYRDEKVLAIQEAIDEMEAGRGRPFRDFDREFRPRKERWTASPSPEKFAICPSTSTPPTV